MSDNADLVRELVALCHATDDDVRLRAQTICTEALVRSLVEGHMSVRVAMLVLIEKEPSLVAKAKKLVESVKKAVDPRQGDI